MIDISDSRFQEQLLRDAKRAHKIDAGYSIPASRRHNTPQRLEEAFAAQRRAGLFSEYPFGTDLTREEIELARALRWLKEATTGKLARLTTVARALATAPHAEDRRLLDRLQLAEPRNFEEKLGARLVSLALRRVARERAATSQTTATGP
jgi:hypothetical protein